MRDLGPVCATNQDTHLSQPVVQALPRDEIWSFCYAKRKKVIPEIAEAHLNAGDVRTWTAIDADTKLIVSYFVGDRRIGSAYEFMSDAPARLKNRVQLTTDQHRAYLTAVEDAFAEVTTRRSSSSI